jgi:hypothetical protein
METIKGIAESLGLTVVLLAACVLFCRGWRWTVVKGQSGF